MLLPKTWFKIYYSFPVKLTLFYGLVYCLIFKLALFYVTNIINMTTSVSRRLNILHVCMEVRKSLDIAKSDNQNPYCKGQTM